MILLSIGVLVLGVVILSFTESPSGQKLGRTLIGFGIGLLLGHCVFAASSCLP